MGSVIQGPWAALPPQWFASVNGGASAFSVQGHTRENAACEAVCRLSAEIRAEVYGAAQVIADECADHDPFALDAASEAEIERRLARECAALILYTPQEWTDHVLTECAARPAATVQHGGAA